MTWQIEELRREYEHEWTTAAICLPTPEYILLQHDLAILSAWSLSLEVPALVNKFLARCRISH
jgi:hypothetical protein